MCGLLLGVSDVLNNMESNLISGVNFTGLRARSWFCRAL